MFWLLTRVVNSFTVEIDSNSSEYGQPNGNIVRFNGQELTFDSPGAASVFAHAIEKFEEFTPELADALNELKKKTSEEDLILDKIKKGDSDIILIFTNDEEAIKKFTVVNSAHDRTLCFVSKDESLSEKVGCSFPGIMTYSATDKLVRSYPMTDENLASVVGFAELSTMFTLSPKNQYLYQQMNTPLFFMVHSSEVRRAESVQAYSKYYELFPPNARIIMVNFDTVKHALGHVNPTEQCFPFIIYFNNYAKYIVRGVKPETIAQDINNLSDLKAERLIFNEEIPEDNSTRSVKVINYDTYPQNVSNNLDKHRIVLFYQENAQNHQLQLFFANKLGEMLAKSNIEVFVFNLSRSDMPDDMAQFVPDITSFYLFKSNESTPTKMSDPISFASFIQELEGFDLGGFKVDDDAVKKVDDLLGKLGSGETPEVNEDDVAANEASDDGEEMSVSSPEREVL